MPLVQQKIGRIRILNIWSKSRKDRISIKIHRLLLFVLLVSLAGCNVTYSVSTKETKSFIRELKAQFKEIGSVKFTFSRPSVTCDIKVKGEPSEQEIDEIVSRVKAFVTVENMKDLAKEVNWKLETSTFYLKIHTQSDPNGLKHKYFTNYFKSFDASDHSEPNIDGYKTWIKAKE